MKVREALNNPSNVTGSSSKDDRKTADTREVSFQGQLKKVESENYEQRLRDLVDRISEQGEKLGRKADIRELKIYKNLISEFLDQAVGNSHKFSKKNLLDRRGRHKVYAVIKKVNEELEQLTTEVLAAEKDNIGVLKRLDDIRGLILDLIL